MELLLLGCHLCAGAGCNQNVEPRLFYVAMTRARNHLARALGSKRGEPKLARPRCCPSRRRRSGCLTLGGSGGILSKAEPSRFLFESGALGSSAYKDFALGSVSQCGINCQCVCCP